MVILRSLLNFSLLFCVVFLSNPVFAQNWWDRAVDIFASEISPSSGRQASDKDTDLGKKLPENVYGNLSNGEISKGLRQALIVGVNNVVSRLGKVNGFNLDPQIHIKLPDTLARVDSALSAIGMGALTDDLELRLNRAAEIATPKAKKLFISAISKMTINDAREILVSGRDDAATSYLRRTMGADLKKEIQPIISKSLASTGAIKAYDSVMGQYEKIPFVSDVRANLDNYVVEKAMDGIFYYVAMEEAAIRNDPVKRTSQILKKVFALQE